MWEDALQLKFESLRAFEIALDGPLFAEAMALERTVAMADVGCRLANALAIVEVVENILEEWTNVHALELAELTEYSSTSN